MILVDTSAWVEFLRGTGSDAHRILKGLIQGSADLAVTEPVVLEILAGARSVKEARELRVRLLSYPILPLRGLADFEEAADIYRSCRLGGETPRSLLDCLIAVPAIREDADLLHADADFEVIARHTNLRLYSATTA